MRKLQQPTKNLWRQAWLVLRRKWSRGSKRFFWAAGCCCRGMYQKYCNLLHRIRRFVDICAIFYMELTESLRTFEGQPITRQILLHLLKDYTYPADKITDLVKKGILTQVKAKVYISGPKVSIRPPEPFQLANHLASPSYVSMQAALSHWRLIPERVYEVTSATSGRSRLYDTPAGRFRYTHLPLPYFSFGQCSVELLPAQVVLLATAEKALCDTVVATAGLLLRSVRRAKEWLLDEMRMDPDSLQAINTGHLQEWLADAPKKDSLQKLIEALEDL